MLGIFGKYENEAEQYRFERDLLFIFSFIVTMSLIATTILQATAEVKEDTLHIPPDLSLGAQVTPGEVPKVNVFSFTHSIWQLVNRWREDGEIEYGENLNSYRSYMTERFGKHLEREKNRKSIDGELRGKARTMSLPLGDWYEEKDVRAVAPGVWEVDIVFDLEEFIDGQSVKKQRIKYPFRVVYLDVDRSKNPLKLALDGYYTYEGPVEIKVPKPKNNNEAPPTKENS